VKPLLTLGAFCKKLVFWTFWRFSGCISAKLALIWSKTHLQHDSLRFTTIKILILIFDFLLPFLFSPFLFFSAVIDLLLGLLAVKKLLRKPHRDGQFLRWSSQA